MNPYFDSMDEVAASIIECFGEPLTVTKMVTVPNRQPTPNPDVPPAIVSGELQWRAYPYAIALGTDHGRFQPNLPDVTTRRPVFTFRVCDLPFPLNRGDVITRRLGDGERFEVTKPLPDGLGMIDVHVVQLGLPSQMGAAGR